MAKATGRERGRPKGTTNVPVGTSPVPAAIQVLTPREARDKADLYLLKNLPKYLKQLHKRAMGVKAIRTTKEGSEVYEVPPDPETLRYLIDRALGKTPQRTEITSEEGGGVIFVPWVPSQEPKKLEEGNVIDVTAKSIPISESDDYDVPEEGEVRKATVPHAAHSAEEQREGR